jgi:hypothetical protein
VNRRRLTDIVVAIVTIMTVAPFAIYIGCDLREQHRGEQWDRKREDAWKARDPKGLHKDKNSEWYAD